MGWKHQKNTPRKIRAIKRATEAVELKEQGLTYAAIGEYLGMAKSAVHKAVTQMMRDYPIEAIDRYREIEDQRIEAVMQVLMPLALAGDLAAIDRLAQQQRNRYALMGIKMPERAPVNEKGEAVAGVRFTLNIGTPGGGDGFGDA